MDLPTLTSTLKNWIFTHPELTILAAFVVFQWMAFQALLIHYHLFRQSLVKKKPETRRLEKVERYTEFQDSQISKLFEKLAEIRKEMHQQVLASPQTFLPESFENRIMSMGEMKLKARLDELKSDPNRSN